MFKRIPTLAIIFTVMALACLPCFSQPAASQEKPPEIKALQKRLTRILGPNDSVILGRLDGTELLAIHADKMLVPASILKVITSLAAIGLLGEDHRFTTEFYQSAENDLSIKGHGDPLLLSEQTRAIAKQIAERLATIRDIFVDDAYFSRSIVIPGRRNTLQPYDAPNGALSVNFNTVAFRRVGGKWLSGEPQTPLLPMVIPRIRASGLRSGRIPVSNDSRECVRYAGELFRTLLKETGVTVKGNVRVGRIDLLQDRLIWTYLSDYALREVVANLLEYSNNFIANQLVLSMGAVRYGAPATMNKGIRTLMDYCNNRLNVDAVRLVEGSGLSRENRITARAMLAVLAKFAPYRHLMHQERGAAYKTGTLSGISTRAGYLDSHAFGPVAFAIMLNTKGKRAKTVMDILGTYLLDFDP